MEWYKTLDINTRINLKDSFQLIVGYSFSDLGRLFSFKARIEICHSKLLLEGFNV